MPAWTDRLLHLAALLGPPGVAIAVLARLFAPQAPNEHAACGSVARYGLEMGAPAVLIGNSTAQRDIDPAALEATLRTPVASFVMPASTPATWYAFLQHQVFGRGLRPELIVIAAPEGAFSTVEPGSALDQACLLDLAGTEDRDLVYRIAGATFPAPQLFRMRLKTEAWRSAVTDALVGNPHMTAAVGFADVAGEGPTGFPPPPRVEDTLVPLLVRVAALHDATLVFVRTPTRPGTALPPGPAGMGEWLEERGVAWIAHAGERIPAQGFEDRFHMNVFGRKVFTDEVVKEVVRAARQGRRRR